MSQHIRSWRRETGAGKTPASPLFQNRPFAPPSRHLSRKPAFGGRELPFREEMEQASGADLSEVEVRFGQEAELAPLGARASTRGHAVDFAAENPEPDLVGHEVVHVLQNRLAGPTAPSRGLSQPDDAAEREAETLGPRLASGQPVQVRTPPAAEVQLGREENLDLQWPLEEKLKKELPKAAYIDQVGQLYVKIKSAVPGLLRTDVEERWNAAMKAFSDQSMLNEKLNLDTKEYEPYLNALADKVRACLAVPTEKEVLQRAKSWNRLKALYPEAEPLLLLTTEYETVASNLSSRVALEQQLPDEEAFLEQISQAYKEAGKAAELPQLDPRQARLYHARQSEKILEQAREVNPELSEEAYLSKLSAAGSAAESAFQVPDKEQLKERIEFVQKVQRNKIPGIEINGFDVVRPDFETLKANLIANFEARRDFLGKLEASHSKKDFVQQLLGLHPATEKSKGLREKLAADAEDFYDEQLGWSRTRTESVSLRLSPAVYKERLAVLYDTHLIPALTVPEAPRQYHASTADEESPLQFSDDVLEDLQGDQNVEVFGASAAEEKDIRRYLVMAVGLKPNSEHRVVVPLSERKVRLLISVDKKGDIQARLVGPASSAPVEESAEEVLRLEKELAEQYSLAPFQELGAAWTVADLKKLGDALALLPSEDRIALRDLTFLRAKTLNKEDEEPRTLGSFSVRPRNRRIQLADIAFTSDLTAFVGSSTTGFHPASAQTIVHEVAHALEHRRQLDAQLALEEAQAQQPPLAFMDPEVSRLEELKDERDSAKSLLNLQLMTFGMSKFGLKEGQVSSNVPGKISILVLEWYSAARNVEKNPETAAEYAQKKAEVKDNAETVETYYEAEQIRQIDTLVIRYYRAFQKAGDDIDVKLEQATKAAEKKIAEHEELIAPLKDELAGATGAKDKKRSQRLEKFVDFVTGYEISPSITPYAESSWKKELYGELYAEAYSLFLTDPDFLRLNYQPLYLYFKLDAHRT